MLVPYQVPLVTGERRYFIASQPRVLLYYRKGGPLALTDANLLLGRIIPDYFPKIFGKSEKEPLDVEASRTAFEKLREDINSQSEQQLSLDEVVYGYVACVPWSSSELTEC